MAVSITVLGSGSGGNCSVVATENACVLVDAGFSRRETLRRLAVAGLPADRFDAILVSHEHSDHVAGLRVIAKKMPAPVYVNRGTARALAQVLPEERCRFFVTGETFAVGDIEITTFTVPHDAADPVAFTFRSQGVKVAVVTDLGYLPENVKDQLRGCDCLVLESNHDLDMLKVGPYPWDLKQRVMSRVGHLSNTGLGEFFSRDYDGHAGYIVLAHLSENNNMPALARLSAEQALGSQPALRELMLAEQHRPLPTLNF